jgi:hypothetical protein
VKSQYFSSFEIIRKRLLLLPMNLLLVSFILLFFLKEKEIGRRKISISGRTSERTKKE